MWTIHHKKAKNKVVTPKSKAVGSLQSYIQTKRKSFKCDRTTALLGLQAQIKSLTTDLTKYNQPHHMNIKSSVTRSISEVQQQIENIQSDCVEKKYEETVKPFIHAQARQDEIKQMEKMLGFEAMPALHLNRNVTDNSYQAESRLVADEYLTKIEGKAPCVLIESSMKCEECEEDLIFDPIHSVMICPMCGMSDVFLDATSSTMAYGEEVEITSFSYKRCTHFKERLTYFQAKESTRVPPEVFHKVMEKLFSSGITTVECITLDTIQRMLKILRLRKYYKQRTQIYCRITGYTPPRLSAQQEKVYLNLFRKMQEPFERHRPADRSNFLSYSYCLYRLSELQGYMQFLKFFPLLKGVEKMKKQDRIFKLICDDLTWDKKLFAFVT
jgi:hypothetical protein